jgi:transcription initiation factor TFIIB
MERLYELRAEWRGAPGEEPERADTLAGIDVTMHDLGLGTKFSVPLDLSPAQRANLRRMQVLQKRSRVMDWADRSLREILMELDKLCEDLSLPRSFKAEVSLHYRRARARRLTVGRDGRLVLASLIFMTCRLRNIPRTGDEISKAVAERFGMERRTILKNMRRFTKLLTRGLKLKLPSASADSYIDRFASRLGLSREAIARAHELVKVLPKGYVQGKPPLFLSAIVMYAAVEEMGGGVTLKEVSSLMGVSISSLSKNVSRVKELLS